MITSRGIVDNNDSPIVKPFASEKKLSHSQALKLVEDKEKSQQTPPRVDCRLDKENFRDNGVWTDRPSKNRNGLLDCQEPSCEVFHLNLGDFQTKERLGGFCEPELLFHRSEGGFQELLHANMLCDASIEIATAFGRICDLLCMSSNQRRNSSEDDQESKLEKSPSKFRIAQEMIEIRQNLQDKQRDLNSFDETLSKAHHQAQSKMLRLVETNLLMDRFNQIYDYEELESEIAELYSTIEANVKGKNPKNLEQEQILEEELRKLRELTCNMANYEYTESAFQGKLEILGHYSQEIQKQSDQIEKEMHKLSMLTDQKESELKTLVEHNARLSHELHFLGTQEQQMTKDKADLSDVVRETQERKELAQDTVKRMQEEKDHLVDDIHHEAKQFLIADIENMKLDHQIQKYKEETQELNKNTELVRQEGAAKLKEIEECQKQKNIALNALANQMGGKHDRLRHAIQNVASLRLEISEKQAEIEIIDAKLREVETEKLISKKNMIEAELQAKKAILESQQQEEIEAKTQVQLLTLQSQVIDGSQS